jgi:hypothetical protein
MVLLYFYVVVPVIFFVLKLLLYAYCTHNAIFLKGTGVLKLILNVLEDQKASRAVLKISDSR